MEYRVVCGDRDVIFSQAGGGGLSMGGQDWKGVGSRGEVMYESQPGTVDMEYQGHVLGSSRWLDGRDAG